MKTTTQPATTATALRVTSVDAEEGLIWAMLDADGRLVGSAAAALWEPISAADAPAADVELWVAPGPDADDRWATLTSEVLSALRLLEVERVLTRAAGEDADRLRQLLAAGFRVRTVGRDGALRLELAA